jgi:hypothetical protein
MASALPGNFAPPILNVRIPERLEVPLWADSVEKVLRDREMGVDFLI